MDAKCFSNTEEKILKIIGRKKLTVNEIVEKFYGPDVPFNAKIIVGNATRKIAEKCKYHRLDWILDKTKETGKHQRLYKRVFKED